MLFLQEAHTVFWTLNIDSRNPAAPRETRKHSQNASTKEPKGSETISCFRRLLPKICTQMRRHLKSTDTPNKKGYRVQMDPECKNCFQILKEFLQQAPILKYPDPQTSYTLYTDPSKYTYTGILTHHSNSTDHPITYISGLFR